MSVKASIILIVIFVITNFGLELPKVEMNPLQKEIIETALSMVGGTYEWGAYDPKGRKFDCWNFVTWVFHHVLDKDGGVKHMLIGIDDPLWVFFDDPKELRTGDVLMNGGEHTVGFHAGIYYGKGFTIEARGKSYGIGVFRIEGRNPRCPFGETGYRFCFYSLLSRLWLHPKPDFHYAYIKIPQSFFFSDEGVTLEFHAYSPKGGEYSFDFEVLDYQSKEVLKKISIKRKLAAGKEHVEFLKLDIEGIYGYVFFRVKMYEKGKVVFEYDTYIRGYVEIM